MTLLDNILIKPFADMAAAPDFLLQVLWEGLVAGVLYALIALGFVLIYKSSRIFNFAQGIMVVFAALTLVGLHEKGVPAWLAVLAVALLCMGLALYLALAMALFAKARSGRAALDAARRAKPSASVGSLGGAPGAPVLGAGVVVARGLGASACGPGRVGGPKRKIGPPL